MAACRQAAFLKLPYTVQWAEGDAILTRLVSGKHEATLSKLGGTSFLEQVKARQAEYGEVLGVTKAKAAPEAVASLVEPLREVQLAVSVYARVLTAAVQNEELDAEVATRALAPIVALRLQQKGRKKAGPAEAAPGAEPVSPEPLPPVS